MSPHTVNLAVNLHCTRSVIHKLHLNSNPVITCNHPFILYL